MYIGLALAFIAVICVVLVIVSGGVFTIVLVPIAAIAAISAVVTAILARTAGVAGTGAAPEPRPLRRIGEDDDLPGEVPATPDDLVEARRREQ